MLGIIKGDIRYDYLSQMTESILSRNLEDLIGIDSLLLGFSGIDNQYNIKNSNLNLLDILRQNSIEVIYTGTANPLLKDLCQKRKIRLVELLKEDDFVIPNAKLTAMGIIDYLQRKNKAVSDFKIFLFGYGNIGFFLAKLLRAYGCGVSVFTKNPIEKKMVLLEGYPLKDYRQISDEELIINTIPEKLEGDYRLFSGKKILDVASSPYGFDIDQIHQLGIDYEIYSAVPSKFAPYSAAKIIERMIKGIEKKK